MSKLSLVGHQTAKAGGARANAAVILEWTSMWAAVRVSRTDVMYMFPLIEGLLVARAVHHKTEEKMYEKKNYS